MTTWPQGRKPVRCSTCTEPAVGYLTENLRPYCAEHLEQMIGVPVGVALPAKPVEAPGESAADAAFLRSLGIEP